MTDAACLLVVVAGPDGERADPAYVVVTDRATGAGLRAAVADGVALVPGVRPGYHDIDVPESAGHCEGRFLVHVPEAEWLTACDLVVPPRDEAQAAA
jgi:hypothetical protein